MNMQMQKYIITDGKQYVNRISGNYANRSSTPSFALEMPFERAKKILLEFPDMIGFRLEGVEDFVKITRDELLQSKQDVIEDAELALSETVDMMNSIDELVEKTCQIYLPEKKTLLADKNKLLDGLQSVDTARSEIDHWIRYNCPPAHIRTKIYGYWREYSNRRDEIKEKLRYIDILLDFADNKISYNEMTKRLRNAKNKPYKPRTPLYAQLDALMVSTKVNNSTRRKTKGAKDNVDIQEAQII